MINLLRRTVSDQLCLEAFLRRGRRYGLYPVDQPTIVQLIEEADETLFNNIRDTIHFTFSTNTNFRPIPDPTQPNPRVIPTGQPTDKCLKCLLLYRLKPHVNIVESRTYLLAVSLSLHWTALRQFLFRNVDRVRCFEVFFLLNDTLIMFIMIIVIAV